MTQPKLTVLMPVYNAERYIATAIDSVLTQGFGAFELLIVDDGSTDRTPAIIRSFDDPRIVTIRQANSGIAGALNRGLAAAGTDLIVRFDADDICMPGRLERQYRFMTEYPDYLLAGSMVDYVDMEGEYVFTYKPRALADEAIRKLPFSNCPFIHSSVVYRRKTILSLGGYQEHAHGFEDHLLWKSLLTVGKVCNLPEVLLQVRFNPGSVTMDETCRSPAYLAIKNEALRKGSIGAEDGRRLLDIMRSQRESGEKEVAYHVLLAKKYLWNNSQPRLARVHARRVIADRHYTGKGLFLWLLSYAPGIVLVWVYRVFNKGGYDA